MRRKFYGFKRAVFKVMSLFLLRITGREKPFLVGLIPCTNLTFWLLSSVCSVCYTLATIYFHTRVERNRLLKGVKASTQEARTMGKGLGI